MKYTINDIAKLAGVSKASVSRVLNDSPSVGQDIKDKVNAILKETNYKPSTLARSLSTKKTKLIGVLVPEIANPIFSRILMGIESEAHKNGYNILLCNSRHELELELKYLDVLSEKQVDGYIIHSYHAMDHMTEKLKSIAKPTVSIDHSFSLEGYPVIRIDNRKAAYDATSYLISKGHHEIGIIHGPLTDPEAGQLRLKGYKDALVEHDIEINSINIVESTFNLKDGITAVESLIKNNPNLTAIFCANDAMAIGAIKGLYCLGYRVPEDISIIGFDGIQLGEVYTPSLTTIEQPFEAKGRSAVETLLQMISDTTYNDEIIHDYKLIERSSTKKAYS